MLSWPTVSHDGEGRDAPGLPFLPPVDPVDAARPAGGAPVTPDAFAGFLVDGDEEVARWALERMLATGPRAQVYDGFLREAMRLVGERWVAGRWTISEEHLASRTLGRVLASLAPEESPVDRLDPVAVLAGVAGEEHAIGLIALSHVLRESGFAVHDLGPNVPADDLVRYAAKVETRLVALTASTAGRAEALRDTAAALRAMPVPPTIIVGGRITELTDLSDTGAAWVGSSLVACAAFASGLARRLAERPRPA
jgi:MerR family transcriptional regulator, light-induced transcriptional regulator